MRPSDPGSPAPPEPELDSIGADAPTAERCDSGFLTPRDSANDRRFVLWMLAATLAYLGATLAARRRDALPVALPWLAVGVALALAVQAIRRYRIFLRDADELVRKIHTDALVRAFAAGAVTAVFYPLLIRLGAPGLNGSETVLVPMVTWGVGIVLGARRYTRDGQH